MQYYEHGEKSCEVGDSDRICDLYTSGQCDDGQKNGPCGERRSGQSGGEQSGHSAIGTPSFVDKKCLTDAGRRGVFITPHGQMVKLVIGREIILLVLSLSDHPT
jgi:hypothetical protein